MKAFAIIRDADLGLDTPPPPAYRERQAARAVLFNGDRDIAILHVTKNGYHKLPGGGVEKEEDIMTALKREVIEEVGCDIGNIRGLGVIEEFRNKFSLHQASYCFLADLAGTAGTPSFEQEEIDDGFQLEWLSLDEAIKVLAGETDLKDYEGKFIQKRNLIFLREAKKLLVS